ncbi:MAG: ribosomal RNA small subunit methyltransferase A [Actinobacteria bacterium]|nr:ribosomal RNA small subunit methyltransferase A [Actinomycetota bacterium]
MAQYISSPSVTADILKKFGIKLRKNLGQNFLTDTNILKKIIKLSGINKSETILEVGSGIGSLTELILEQAQKVICIELDARLVSVFKEIMKTYNLDNAVLIEKDAMRLDYLLLSRDYSIKKMVSNLPYKIAAPLILKILLEAPGIEKMYLTIQKDIAERLLAKKGDKNYSSYSIKTGFLADFKILFNIQKTCFMPAPHVDSVFIEVSARERNLEGNVYKYQDRSLSLQQVKRFFNFIDACFANRRKKMINSIENSGAVLPVDKMDLMIKMLHVIGKNKDIRAEQLELNDFLEIFIALENDNNLNY